MATSSSALESSAINRISYRMALLDLCVNVAEGNVRIEATLHAQMVCHADHLLDDCVISVPYHVAGFVTFGRPRLCGADFETKHLRYQFFTGPYVRHSYYIP